MKTNQVILLTILGVLTVSWIVPQVMIWSMFSNNGSFWQNLLPKQLTGDEDWEGRKIKRALTSRQIVQGGNQQSLLKMYNVARDLTALPGEAARGASNLQIVVFKTGDTIDSDGKTVLTADGFLPVVLDLSKMDFSRLLLLADSPVIWRVKGTDYNYRGRVGFEGLAPFQITGAEKGLLASTRVLAFGARRPTNPRWFFKTADLKDNDNKICASIKNWLDIFGVEAGAARIFKVIDDGAPLDERNLIIEGSGVFSDTSTVKKMAGVLKYCPRMKRRRR